MKRPTYSGGPHAGTSVSQSLMRLSVVRRRYGPGITEEKLALLESLRGARLGRRTAVEQLHQHLLFLRAFPDDSRVLAAVTVQLASFGRRVRALRADARCRLEDTGIVGTASRHCFDAPIVDWLIARFPGQVDIDWRGFREPRRLEFLLRFILLGAEEDGFDSVDVDTREWIRRAKGTAIDTDLGWLLATLRRNRTIAPLWPALWEQTATPVIWRLSGSGGGAVTCATLPSKRIRYRTNGLRPPPSQPRRLITKPMRRIELLGRKRGQQIVDLTRAALTARCREVYAVTHANADEVYLADLGEGASVAVIGVHPQMRLSLEANYGFLLIANGVPVGYGGVTPLFRQANTGINVFDAYRGSEAAMLWAQTLRAFHSLFGVTRFIVNAYQFGAGNSEAIASGAFWFYYRLGFRPVTRAACRLAAREFARPGRRADPATLRKLARGDLELSLPGARASDRFDEQWLERLSLRASERLASLGPLGRSEKALLKGLRKALGITRAMRWTREARLGLRCLGPLIALIDDVAAWPARQRVALIELLSAKGARQEAGFVRAARRLPLLFATLAKVARRPDAVGGIRER